MPAHCSTCARTVALARCPGSWVTSRTHRPSSSPAKPFGHMEQPSSPSIDDPARRAEIGLCVLLAAADGDVSEEEISALSSRLGSLVGDDYPAMALGVMVEDEIEKMGALGPDRYVRTLVDRLPQARRVSALRGALGVACADGLAPEEERMFRDVALELGIEGTAADQILAEALEKKK